MFVRPYGWVVVAKLTCSVICNYSGRRLSLVPSGRDLDVFGLRSMTLLWDVLRAVIHHSQEYSCVVFQRPFWDVGLVSTFPVTFPLCRRTQLCEPLHLYLSNVFPCDYLALGPLCMGAMTCWKA